MDKKSNHRPKSKESTTRGDFKPCRFFLQGSCKFSSEECRFSHETSSSTLGSATNGSVTPQKKMDPTRVLVEKFTYQSQRVPKEQRTIPSKEEDEYSSEKRNGRRTPKNTESFEPNYTPADLRVLVDVAGTKKTSSLSFQSKDVVVVPDLFGSEDDWTIHNKLLDEMEKSGIDSDRLWKLWHGDSHMIADDSTHFKEKCPTFLKVLDRIRDYFGMDIKATRFNLYRDDKDWKPFHFDASAVKPEKAKIQNITVGVSFGRTRDIAFEDAVEGKGHRRVVSFPMPNGYTYAFCKDINTNWRHGVPAIPVSKGDTLDVQHRWTEDQQTDKSRISIIAWGWRNQVDI